MIILSKGAILTVLMVSLYVEAMACHKIKKGGLDMPQRLRVCLALCGCLALLSGCAGQPTVSDSPTESLSSTIPGQGPSSFALPYSHDDTLNPFAASTEVNLRLATLLYDSLMTVDAAFVPRQALASSVKRVDATHLAAVLREGAVFSDGSAVTLQDVTRSFEFAKASANYKTLLSNVTAAKADKQTRRVIFTLAGADPHAEACLSFPIIKCSTVTKEAGKAPVGGGVYRLQNTDVGDTLVANQRYRERPQYTTIGLRHLPNSDAMYYGLSAGDITYYFNDLNSGEIPRVSGANLAVDMNALLFVGIHSQHAALSQPAVRQALSLLPDRPALATGAYSGWAQGSSLPFHPAWKSVADLALPVAARDLDGALARLTAAGYGNAADGKPLNLQLVYCTDNRVRARVVTLLCTQMESAGIQITPVPLSYADYMARLKAGKYDLYLGEIRLTADMSLRPLLAGGAASYGIQRSGASAVAYARYLNGEIDLKAFLDAFSEDVPYIPLCWLSGFAAYDRRLTSVTPTGYDAYYGIAAWK